MGPLDWSELDAVFPALKILEKTLNTHLFKFVLNYGYVAIILTRKEQPFFTLGRKSAFMEKTILCGHICLMKPTLFYGDSPANEYDCPLLLAHWIQDINFYTTGIQIFQNNFYLSLELVTPSNREAELTSGPEHFI